MTEAMLVLATIGQHFRLRLVPDHPIEPVGLMTLRPRHGILMTLAPRA
jgi:cytochrome P450